MPSRNRGRPKAKITDISRTPPTQEELNKLTDLLSASIHPLPAAVLGAVLVEHELEAALRRQLKCDKDDDAWKELSSDVGPLRGFYAKIVMGHALGMYDNDVLANLNIVRNIRNQFAHARRLFDFSHHLIGKELQKSRPIKGERKIFRDCVTNNPAPQDRYISLCMLLAVFFAKGETKSARARARRAKNKWAQEMARALFPLENAQGWRPLSDLERRLAGPNHATPPGWLGEALHKSAKPNGNKGK